MASAASLDALRGARVAPRHDEIRDLVDDSGDPQILNLVAGTEAFGAFAAGQLEDARAAWRGIAGRIGSELSLTLPARHARHCEPVTRPAPGRTSRHSRPAASMDPSRASRKTIRAGIAGSTVVTTTRSLSTAKH